MSTSRPNDRKHHTAANADLGTSTRAVHGYPEQASDLVPDLVPPVWNSAAFAFPGQEEIADAFQGRSPRPVYSRIANPTVTQLERRVAFLTGGTAALASASGMGALTTVLMTLAEAGDEIVVSRRIFGGTIHLLDEVLPRFGVRSVFVDAEDPAAVAEAAGEQTALILVESISNPALTVPDFARLGELSQEKGIPLVVDATVTPPPLFDPGAWGAALAVYSTTKYLAGSGTVVGGVSVDTGAFDWRRITRGPVAEHAQRIDPRFAFAAAARNAVHIHTGGCMDAHTAFLTLLGLETVELRLSRQCESALTLARDLRENEHVTHVGYPGLEDHPSYPAAARFFQGGSGAIVTFCLDSAERCYRAARNLRIARNVVNLGDSRTLVVHPWSTIYHDHTDRVRRDAGVYPEMLRVSVGIENAADIVGDFRQALEAAHDSTG